MRSIKRLSLGSLNTGITSAGTVQNTVLGAIACSEDFIFIRKLSLMGYWCGKGFQAETSHSVYREAFRKQECPGYVQVVFLKV